MPKSCFFRNGPAAGVVCVFGFDGYMQRDAMDIFERNYVSSQDRSDFTKFDNLVIHSSSTTVRYMLQSRFCLQCGRNEYEAAPYIETAESVEQMTDTPILIKSGIRFVVLHTETYFPMTHMTSQGFALSLPTPLIVTAISFLLQPVCFS